MTDASLTAALAAATAGAPPKAGGADNGPSAEALAAAREEGRRAGVEAGAQAATERLAAALGADGVKGDAGRMAAALDLAVKSPAMSGDDVAAFVVANVPAAKAAHDNVRMIPDPQVAAADDAPAPGAAQAQGLSAAVQRMLGARH